MNSDIILIFQLPPYEVAIHPELNAELGSVINQLNLLPVSIDPSGQEPQMILKSDKKAMFFDVAEGNSGVISWSPPIPNWNPWTGSNIDEGPLAHVSLLFLVC